MYKLAGARGYSILGINDIRNVRKPTWWSKQLRRLLEPCLICRKAQSSMHPIRGYGHLYVWSLVCPNLVHWNHRKPLLRGMNMPRHAARMTLCEKTVTECDHTERKSNPGREGGTLRRLGVERDKDSVRTDWYRQLGIGIKIGKRHYNPRERKRGSVSCQSANLG